MLIGAATSIESIAVDTFSPNEKLKFKEEEKIQKANEWIVFSL